MGEKYNHKIFIFIFILLFTFDTGIQLLHASSSVGTIDDTYKYAKGFDQNDIKINFGLFKGSVNIVVTDVGITGFAWGENIGWINLSPSNSGVLNNGEGVLSGYATSEFGGWINFKPENGGVTINSSGEFLGYALSQNFGLISFNCINNNSCAVDDFKVKTDWRPFSVRNNGEIYIPPDDIIPVIPPNTGVVINEEIVPKVKPLPIVDNGQYKEGDVIKYSDKTITFTENKENIDGQNTFSNDIVSSINKKTKEINSFIQEKSIEIKKEVVVISNSPVVEISTKTVTAVGVAGGSTAIFSSFLGSTISFSELFLNFFRIWSLFLSAIGLRKKTKPWGTIYDSVTKQPIDPAYVVLQDKDNNEIATAITDFDGRFGFLVKLGVYKIYVRKNNYSFPSRKLFGKESDELYNNLYFGEYLNFEEDKLIIKNIPMDPEKFDWNEFTKKDKKLLKFSSPYAHIFAKISNIVFYLGFILSIILLIINTFNYYNLFILVFYLFLFLLRRIGIKIKSYGNITERSTGFPISFAVVRVFAKGSKNEVFHRIADKYGHYYCLLPKGEYYVIIEKKNDDESYSKIYFSEEFVIKNGILNKDFKV